jgi:acyl dehydratase
MDSKTIEVGYELPTLIKKITEESIYNYSMRYSGTYVKMIHVDKDSAKRLGFPELVVQGSQTLDYANEMLFKVFGKRAIDNCTINAVFTKPVLSGDVLTVKGKVKEKKHEASETYVVVDIWVENKSNEKVMLGDATINIGVFN